MFKSAIFELVPALLKRAWVAVNHLGVGFD